MWVPPPVHPWVPPTLLELGKRIFIRIEANNSLEGGGV